MPRGAHAPHDVSEHVADNATLALTAQTLPARRVSFKAGAKGDTVAAVARRYRLNPGMVAQWNKVGPQATFKAGQTVIMMLPNQATAGPTKRGAKPADAARPRRR